MSQVGEARERSSCVLLFYTISSAWLGVAMRRG